MPRNLSTNLQTHLAESVTTTSRLICIKRTDGVQIGFTDSAVPITYNGLVFYPNDSDALSAFTASTDSIDNADITGILSSSRITEKDLANGLYDGARYQVYLVNRKSIADGAVILATGMIGSVTFGNGYYEAEARGLSEMLKQSVGEVTSRDCRATLFDVRCKLSRPSYQVSRTVSAVGTSLVGAIPAAAARINVGGSAVGSWSSDTGLVSGGTSTNYTTGTIQTSGAVNPAPQGVYQTWRFGGTLQYNIPSLTPGTKYTVRLHFIEDRFGGAGGRQFDVYAQGDPIIYKYDIWAAAGGKWIATVLAFDVTADASGNIALLLGKSTSDQPELCGIEVLTKQQPTIASGLSFGSDTKPSGYYTAGRVTFTTGANAGKFYEIEAHIAQGGSAVISLRDALVYPVSVGDQATLEPGCDFTLGCCAYKFGNAINFRGEPHLPGNNVITQVGR